MNIEDLSQIADSTPEDAAKNIENASIFSIEPSAYKAFKNELNTQADQLKRPRETTQAVSEYMKQSTEHASLTFQDIPVLEYMERQARSIWDHVTDRPTNERKIIDLSLRKMDNPDAFSEDDEITLQLLNEERGELSRRNYGLDGPIEQLPSQIAGAVTSMVTDTARGAVEGFGMPGPSGPGGLAFKISAGIFKDQYDQMVGSTYNELSNLTDETGNTIQIDNETKKNISRGVGIVGSTMSGFVGAALARTTPHLARFMSPRAAKMVVLDPSMAAVRQTLANIGKAAAVGGGTAGATEMARIIGEEMGRTYDGSEASFLNALQSTMSQMDTYAPRLAQAAAVGAGTAGTIAAATGVAGFRQTRQGFQQAQDAAFAGARDVTPQAPRQLQEPRANAPQAAGELPPLPPGDSPITQSTKIIQLKEAMTNMSRVSQQAKMSTLAPNEMASVQKLIFTRAGMERVWIGADDFKKWATDPKKAEAARNIIDPSGVAASQMNAPIKVEASDFMNLAKQHPDILDLMRIDPEGPTPTQAEKFIKAFDTAEAQRQSLIEDTGLPGGMTEESRQTIQSALNSEFLKETGDDVDWLPTAPTAEHKYMQQPTFTKAIENVISDAEVAKFNKAQMEVRQMVVDQIKANAWMDMMKVQDLETENVRQMRMQTELDRLANNPNYDIVDKFRNSPIIGPMQKGKKAPSQYAIDPKSLTTEQLKYLDDARIKEHRVFAKPGTGITADQSAQLLGLNNGDELLKTLASTPTRKQVTQARAAAFAADDAMQVRDRMSLDQSKMVEAFNNNTKLHIQEMKFMREKQWPATKTGIKRIALPLPRSQELNRRARMAVGQTRVGDLNVNQFKVGERKSQKAAVDAILKNEVETAFQAKEAAALNSEFQKETMLAIARVNRVFRFTRKFNEPSTMNALKSAGPSYERAANEILDLYNLSPSKKGLAERDSFIKWVKSRYEAGEGDFEIPDRFADVRESATQLTVDQVEVIGARLANILHLAKMKNRLFTKWENIKELQTVEAFSEKINNALINHPGYDKNRIPSVQETRGGYEKVARFFSTVESAFTNMEHILRELDEGKPAGMFQEIFMHPLKGDGEFQGKSGYTKELDMTKKFATHMREQIKAYGEKDFALIESKILTIPEFADAPGLNNGKLTKGDLMTLWAYSGDPYTKAQRAKNNGISDEVMQTVFDRELERRDVEFMQKGVVDYFKTYREETAALQMETNGTEVKFVEGTPNVWKGEVFDGGYVPAKYRVNYTDTAIERVSRSISDQKAKFFEGENGEYYAAQYAAEQTEQGRLIERTGSENPLDTSLLRMIRGNEEIIHDLSYRKVIRDSLRLLRIPSVREDMIATVGEQKYGVLVNTVIEKANQIEAENANYFSDQTRMFKQMFGTLQSNFSISVLGLNITSSAIQYQSIAQVAQNMGPSAPKYLLNVNKKIAAHPDKFVGFYDFANELDPTIGRFVEQLQDKLSSTVHDLLPSKNIHPKLTVAKNAHEFAIEMFMAPMSVADVHLKMMSALASYEQFMGGDVANYPMERLNAMSAPERHAQAQAYVRQISRLSLTHGRDEDKAAFQKTPMARFFANYWNDLRNTLNNQINQGRKVKWSGTETIESLQQGDLTGAKSSSKRMLGGVMGVIAVAAVSKAIDDIVRGDENPISGLAGGHLDLSTPEGIANASQYTMGWLMNAPLEQTLNAAPFIRDIKYAASNPMDRNAIKEVSLPITKMGTDIATAWASIPALLDADRDLSKGQVKAWLYSMSYLLTPLPVNGAYKAMKFFEEKQNEVSNATSAIENISKSLNAYLNDPPEGVSDDFLKQLEEMKMQIEPQDAVAAIPEDTYSTFKSMASGNQWNKVDPETGAAGVYQFTEAQWNEIMRDAPELGLTENGRVSKNPEQQEAAMKWQTERNAQSLADAEIPVDKETLYSAHLFGPEKTIKLYQTAGDTKLKSFGELTAAFAKFKTVGQVRKAIKSKVRDNELTLSAQGTED